MPDIKEKDARPKIKGRSKAGLPREMGQQMKEKAVRELRRQDPSHPEPQEHPEQQSAGEYAADRLEDGTRQTGHFAVSTAKNSVRRYSRNNAPKAKQRRQEEYRRRDAGSAPPKTDTAPRPDMPYTSERPSQPTQSPQSSQPSQLTKFPKTSKTPQTYYTDAAQRRHYSSTATEYEPLCYSGDIPEPQRRLWKEKAIKAKQEKMRRDAYHAPGPVQERGELALAIKERGADSVIKDYYSALNTPASEYDPTATTIETYAPTTPAGEDHRPDGMTGRERRTADAAGREQRPAGPTVKEREYGKAAIKERRIDSSVIRERKPSGAAVRERKANAAIAPKTKSVHVSAQTKPSILQRRYAARQLAKRAERQARQHTKKQAAEQAVKVTAKAAKAAGGVVVKIGKAVGAALAKSVGAIIAAGGGILLVALLFIGVIAAIAASPFGLFFASEQNGPDAVSVAEAVAQVNIDFNNRLEALQAGEYDEIIVEGTMPDWAEVLAVFASKTAGADEGVDVATMDAERVALLKTVFWDMTALSSATEAIDHPDSDPDDDVDDSYTERILTITISAKTADEMRTVYAFTDFQNDALTELLADTVSLSSLAGDLTITNADAVALLDALPDDLDPARRAVIKAACSLVGKVGYFWGGKSLVIGWDSRWGTLRKVTSEGSDTTGAYRPYGLDCSGFVDWAFYNATDGGYYPGHGGGTVWQHSYCTDIPWEDAQPGDLVFYAGDEHVGIVGGWDAEGNMLVIHCGGAGVSITGADDFAVAARPEYFD